MTAAKTAPKSLIVTMWSDMDRWVVPTTALMGGKLPNNWITDKVGGLVRLVTDRVQVEPDREYKMAGVRWYGKGVFHRETVRGEQMSAKYVAPLRPGALIYNRLFAWKASFAVVPSDLSDCHVSSEFPQFIPDPLKLLTEYMYLWSVTAQTIRAVNAASTGSAAVSRNRFREEFFLEFETPIPPLTEQRAIVSKWEQSQAEIANIRKRIVKLEQKIEVDFLGDLGLSKPKRTALPKVFGIWWKDFDRWSIEYIRRTISEPKTDKHKYPICFLGDLCTGQSGSTPLKRSRAYWNGKFPWVSPKDMKTDLINDTIDHITEDAIASGKASLVPPGSVLVVVRSGILQHTVPIAVNTVKVSINQDMRALTPKPDVPVIGGFIAAFLKYTQHKLLSQVKWSTTVQSINKECIEMIEVPLPPLDIQHNLVDKVKVQRKTIAALKTEADLKSVQAKADVEAMILGVKPVPEGH